MSKARLVPCPTCSRHFRADEAACPFCSGHPLSDLGPTPIAPSVRLSRAALYALGVGTISLSAACGGDVAKGGTDSGRGLGMDSSSTDSSPGDSSSPSDSSSPMDTGNVAVPYGVPAFDSGIFDSGTNTDATEPRDATPPPFDGPAPPYGQPPRPPRDE